MTIIPGKTEFEKAQIKKRFRETAEMADLRDSKHALHVPQDSQVLVLEDNGEVTGAWISLQIFLSSKDVEDGHH